MTEDHRASRRPAVNVMPAWSIWSGAAGLVLLMTVVTWLFLLLFDTGTTLDRIRLEVIKTACSIVVGTGGAVALFLAARRQRSTEIALRLQDADLDQKERAADDVRHDATERRINDLYTAAVEQLGSDKAPVRFGGLYALDRIADLNPAHRQLIVDVMCAYLRMPDPEEGDHESSDCWSKRQAREEFQVRRAAQRLLTSHLRPYLDNNRTENPRFWPDTDIDLTGATLHNWNLDDCRIRTAALSHAQFRGRKAQFTRTHFHGHVWLRGAQFHCPSDFSSCCFHQEVELEAAHFNSEAMFNSAQFKSTAWFDQIHFGDETSFESTQFHDSATLSNIHFHAMVKLNKIQFYGPRILHSVRVRGDMNRHLPPGWRIDHCDKHNDGGLMALLVDTPSESSVNEADQTQNQTTFPSQAASPPHT